MFEGLFANFLDQMDQNFRKDQKDNQMKQDNDRIHISKKFPEKCKRKNNDQETDSPIQSLVTF